VANLILARTVRREGELAVRAALGASSWALRRMLLAESVLLCGACAAIGVMSAQPLLTILARYASRFSVRVLDLTVDFSLLWIGAALAIIAAVILAFVPRLPLAGKANGRNVASGSMRTTSSTSRRQRAFSVTQIAASFVLLARASALITTLLSLRAVQTGFDMPQVLAIDVPAMTYGKTSQQVLDFYKEAIRQIAALPGVTRTAFGLVAPWRDADNFGPGAQYSADGHAHGNDDPRAHWRTISPGFFAALGVPILEGRDFNDLDTKSTEPVAIVSQTLAQRMFPDQHAVVTYTGLIRSSNSSPGATPKSRDSWRHIASLVSPRTWTMNTLSPSLKQPFTAPLPIISCSKATSLSTRMAIRMPLLRP
jgi:hypothetical protein